MADANQTLQALQNLRLSELSEEFVDSVWDGDFLENEPIPEKLEQSIKDENYYVAHLGRVVSVFTPWARSGRDSTSQGFWHALTEDGQSSRTLIALLHYFISCPRRSSGHRKQAAALSANIYFILTSIPGSVAYKVFHPVLFQKAVDVLKLWPECGSGGKRKRGDDVRPSSQGGNRRGKQARRDNHAEEDIDEDFGMDSDDDSEAFELTPQEIIQIKRKLLDLVKELVRLLKSFSLKHSDQATDHMTQILAEMCKIDVELSEGHFDPDEDLRDISCMSLLAYSALAAYCNQLHGKVENTLIQVLGKLVPSILMLMGENGAVAATTIPKPVQTVKNHAVAFVCYLIDTRGETALKPVHTLLQNVSWKVPDKAEYRSKVSEAVVTILEKLPTAAYVRFLQWLVKNSKHSKTGHRMSSLETAGQLLDKPTRQPDENTTPEVAACLSHQYLLQNIILSRCSDKSAVVRSKALSCFANCISSSGGAMQDIIMQLFCPTLYTPADAIRIKPIVNPGSGEKSNDMASPSMGTPSNLVTPCTTPGNQVTPNTSINLSVDASEKANTAKATLAMLRKRASDEKSGVRKSAIQAIESIIKLDMANISKEDIQVIRVKCQDAALSVRKQAMISLTGLLLAKPESNVLQSMWIDGVVPMVTDREQGCQEKCLDIMENVFLNNIVSFERTISAENNMMWDIMNKIAREEQEEYRYFLQKACQQWAKQSKLTPRIMSSLITHANTDHGPGAWILLSMVARHCPKLDHSFIHKCWEDFKSGNASITSNTLVHVVNVIGYTAKHLGVDLKEKFIKDFKNLLKKFTASPSVILAVTDALCQLCNTLTDDSVTNSWRVELMSECDKYLSSVLLSETPNKVDEDKLNCYLFTLGGIIQLAPDKVPRRIKTLVLSILAGPKIAANLKLSQQSQSSQPSQSSQIPLSQLHNSNLSDRVQAFALNTLGKLYLVDESLAKQAIAPLAKELEESALASIRCNAVIILCDLCVRYPSLVDRYIPNIAACVRDEHPLVRKQTLTMVTHLLQEDYIKWKGVLFYRFISALVDDVEEIRQFVEFCMGTLLGKRHPLMFFNHFVECVFHFNEYNNHNVYNKFAQTDRERKLFSLKGKQNSAKRMKIYKFLLENMNDEHRFQITAKLCQEILGGLVDNAMPYDEDSQDLLKDALAILSSKEIKLRSLKTRSPDEMEEETVDVAGAAAQKIKTTIISHAVKKNVIENIVPIIISLKHMLEKHRSPVLRDLMLYLASVMKEYKNELKDILAADRQLASEIEFDLRKFEEEQKQKDRLEKEKNLRRSRQSMLSPRGTPTTARSSPNVATPQSASRPRSAHNVPTPSSLPRPNSAPIPPMRTPLNTQRNRNLASFAIHNSAKKVIEEINKRRSKSLSDIHNINEHRSVLKPFPTPELERAAANPTEQPASAKSRRGTHPREENRGQQADSEVASERTTPAKRVTKPPDFRTPAMSTRSQPGRADRAISTPDKSIANITFYNDISSIVPPSPIPTSLPIRLCSDASPKDFPGTASFLPRLESDEEVDPQAAGKKDLICMFSPEHPTPRPRTWHVTPKDSKVLTERNRKPSRGSTNPGTSSEEADPQEKRTTRSKSGNTRNMADGLHSGPANEAKETAPSRPRNRKK